MRICPLLPAAWRLVDGARLGPGRREVPTR
jgi:hypothetical protein